jgi:hypothetical protein
MRYIPTFNAAGRRDRRYSLEAIERLLALKMITPKYHKRTGAIIAAQFLPKVGRDPKPLTIAAILGQHYCRQRRVTENARVWELNDLPKAADLRHRMTEDDADNPAAVDAFIRAVFCAVPLTIASHRTNAA